MADTKYIQTHVSIVIDRSGSMSDCWGEMVNAVNSWLKDARGDDNLKESDVELTVFDTQSIDTLRKGAPVNMQDLVPSEALPRGGTPLYDAVGRGLDSLDGRLKSSGSHKAILIIVTDGQENSSTKYGFTQLQETLKARQAAGWTVLFLGAGLEAAAQGAALGVYANKLATIGKSASNLQASSRAMYDMSSGAAATMDFQEAETYAATASFSNEQRAAMGGGNVQPSQTVDVNAWKKLYQQPQVSSGGTGPAVIPSAFATPPQKKDEDTWEKKDAWTRP